MLINAGGIKYLSYLLEYTRIFAKKKYKDSLRLECGNHIDLVDWSSRLFWMRHKHNELECLIHFWTSFYSCLFRLLQICLLSSQINADLISYRLLPFPFAYFIRCFRNKYIFLEKYFYSNDMLSYFYATELIWTVSRVSLIEPLVFGY